MIKAFFKYRKSAVNEYEIHSPFVFEFYTEVVKKAKYHDDELVEHVRKMLLRDQRAIEVMDLGQGSRKNNSVSRRISEIAKVQSINRKYGRLLGTIVKHYRIENCLELGTSLGLGAGCMAQYAKNVVTIEGSENIYEEAKRLWSPRYININFIQGEFSEVLPEVLNSIEKLDLIYIDGNHGYEPTLKYFNMLLEKANNDTFIIFDDINWSEDMRKAWDEICADKRIHVSLEFFRMGIVLKREQQAKEHFVLKF